MKSVKAEVQDVQAVTMDGSCIDLVLKTTDGPDYLLDKRIRCRLTKATLEQLTKIFKGGV